MPPRRAFCRHGSSRFVARSLSPQAASLGRWSARPWARELLARQTGALQDRQSPLAVIEWNADFTVAAWNLAAERIFGYAASEVIGMNGLDLLVPASQKRFVTDIWARLSSGRPGGERSTNQNIDKNGKLLWCEWYNTPRIDEQGRIIGVFSVAQDVTPFVETWNAREAAFQALTESEERFRLLNEHASELAAIIGSDGIVRYVTDSIYRILGYNPQEFVGSSPGHLVHEDDLLKLRGLMGLDQLAHGEASAPTVHRFRHKNGTWRWMESIGTNLQKEPLVGGLLLNCRDVTERIEAEEKLRWQARHDGLTGLPNRTWFMSQVGEHLAWARRSQHNAALFFIDLNRFKWVNDTLGHDAGDALLQDITKKMRAALPEGALLARLSGDEFALLLPFIASDADAEQCARTLLHALSTTTAANVQSVRIGASIGIAVFPRDGGTASELIKSADAAMYEAKSEDGSENSVSVDGHQMHAPRGFSIGAYRFFKPEMKDGERKQHAFDMALRHAVQSGDGFHFVFQPIGEGSEPQKWKGVEALLRWQHSERCVLLPAEFLPTVENLGLLEPLNRWVLHEACRTLAQWRGVGVDLPVWVNVGIPNALETATAVLVEQIEAALEEFSVSPDALVLELTPAMVCDAAAAERTLHALKGCGVGLALDDWGVGNSPYAALRQFPFDTLKIEAALLERMEQSPEDVALVQTAIDLGHALHFRVVAEGVQTPVQQAQLRDMGCDLMQGYGVCRPLLAPDFLRALAFSPAPLSVVRETNARVEGQSVLYVAGYNKNNEVAATHG